MIKENLISTSVPYKVGQRLIKVGNSFIPVGFGGNGTANLTLEESNAGSMKFYKCTSINTIDKTWTGYKAVLVQDKTYSFEENITEGLTFGNGFTPVVGKIYNGNATVRVEKLFEGASAVPEDGLIFWLPFNGTDEPVVGNIAWKSGEVSYGEANGIKYAQFDRTQMFLGNLTSAPDAYTVSVSFRVHGGSQTIIIGSNAGFAVGVNTEGSDIRLNTGGLPAGSFTFGTWINVLMTAESGGNTLVYVNGAVDGNNEWCNGSYRYDLQDALRIATDYNRNSSKFTGDMFDVAVWNRVLTPEEIAQVAGRAVSLN